MFDVAIIGGGVVGCATAYKLSKYKLKACLIEKENDVALGATRANSAIIHAGFDAHPGTKMARLNVDGARQAKLLAKKLSVHYINNGAMVLAFNDEEAEKLKELYDRGIANGVPDIEIITGDEVRKREPNASAEVVCALYAPTSGIINPWEYAIAFGEVAAQNGVEFIFNYKVTSISKAKDCWKISNGTKEIEAKYVINAAGVHSDEIHNMVAAPTFTMLPSKGQYYILDKSDGSVTHHTLFQCPSRLGKGVLVSPTVHGNLIVGPDATENDERDSVSTTSERLDFVRNTAAKSVKNINYKNSIRNFAGVRANTDKKDFIIEFAQKNFLDLAGIKSPGLSSAPAIGDEAVNMLRTDGLMLTEKESYTDERKHICFKDL